MTTEQYDDLMKELAEIKQQLNVIQNMQPIMPNVLFTQPVTGRPTIPQPVEPAPTSPDPMICVHEFTSMNAHNCKHCGINVSQVQTISMPSMSVVQDDLSH